MGSDRLAAILADIAELPSFAAIATPSVMMRSPVGETPLHIAAARGDIEAVRVLLDAGAEPNAVGEHNYTPLHEALEQGHPQVARMLIAAGASLDAANVDGATAREMAKALCLWEAEH